MGASELPGRYLQGESLGGMDTIVLQNDRVSLAIVPAAGGKIETHA